MCSCDLPGGSGALAMGPMRDLHLHRETAPGKVEQWWSGVLGTRAAGTSCSWVVAGALFRLGSHQSPTLSAGPFGGYPWLFSFPLIYDPFVLKPYSQAPSPLPSHCPEQTPKYFCFLWKNPGRSVYGCSREHTHLCGAAGTAGNSGTGAFWNWEHVGASLSVQDCHSSVGSSCRRPSAAPGVHAPTRADPLLDPTCRLTYRGRPVTHKHSGVPARWENTRKHGSSG